MEIAFLGGQEVIREALRTRLVSPVAILVVAMLMSLSESTIKQYSRPLRLWCFSSAPRSASLFPNGLSNSRIPSSGDSIFSYSSLNTMKSAISLISQNEIGQHPAIRRFCKGVAELNPPQQRYDYIGGGGPCPRDRKIVLHPPV